MNQLPAPDSPGSSAVQAPRRSPPRGAQRGMALVEIALALLVLAVATLGSVSWTLSGMSLDTDNQETAEAQGVLRHMLEELQTVPFDEVFTRFNGDPDDDPDGPGTAPGGALVVETTRTVDFLVREVLGSVVRVPPPSVPAVKPLRQVPIQVHVEFPTDASGRLSEAAIGSSWGGLSWDLDGDGSTDSGEVAANAYRMLPVRLRLTWTSARGTPRALEHIRLLSRRDYADAAE